MPITLTFGTATKLSPVSRDNGFSAQENPLNRNIKTVMKGGTAGIDGTWIQQFDPAIGWLPETQISTTVANSDGQMRHDYNSYGDVVYLFARWNGATTDLYALWKDGTGTYADIGFAVDTPVAFAPSSVTNNRWGVTAIDNATRDFWVFYVKYDAFALGDLWGSRFSGTTRTWSAPQNFGRPGGGGAYCTGPTVCDWQALNNTIHIAVGATSSGGGNANVYYKKYDITTATMDAAWTALTAVVFPNELMFGVAGSEMDAMCDTLDADQFYIVATRFNNSSANWDACDILFFEKDTAAGPNVWKAAVRISDFATQGAHFPTILVDQPGDLFFVWTEFDTVAGKKTLYVKQRDHGTTTWSAKTTVATSLHATTAADADPDPEHPGIIRPPHGRPLLYLCITWGDIDTPSGDVNSSVFVNCALVRTEEELGFEEGVGGQLANKEMRMYDVPAGQLWWRLKGYDNA